MNIGIQRISYQRANDHFTCEAKPNKCKMHCPRAHLLARINCRTLNVRYEKRFIGRQKSVYIGLYLQLIRVFNRVR